MKTTVLGNRDPLRIFAEENDMTEAARQNSDRSKMEDVREREEASVGMEGGRWVIKLLVSFASPKKKKTNKMEIIVSIL